MKVQSKKDFFRVLKKSRLLSPNERVAARAAAQGISEPETIARQLMESGRLTRWQASQLLAGKSKFFLGKYKLLKICGRGGMGVVFKAEQPDIARTVAIKVLHRSLLAKPRAVTRFQREMRLAATLNHPNLVVAYDADQTKETHYLVMEYVSGKSLKYYSQKHGPMPVRWSCECIRQAALGLAHIHERGLVHRDIKPSNVLIVQDPLSRDPRVKILDVGLSRFVSDSEAEGDDGLTKAGQILGTMDYMAPEQIKDARSSDIRADIYGLGATLFQLLTGKPPLAGETLMQTYMARMTQDAPLVSGLRDGISPALDQIISRMLERDPEKRYQIPAHIAEDLVTVISGTHGELRARTQNTGSSESISPILSSDYSTDDDSCESLPSEESHPGSSLFMFLDQLSQDEPSENISVDVQIPFIETYAAQRQTRSDWDRFWDAARRWVRSLLPASSEGNTRPKNRTTGTSEASHSPKRPQSTRNTRPAKNRRLSSNGSAASSQKRRSSKH